MKKIIQIALFVSLFVGNSKTFYSQIEFLPNTTFKVVEYTDTLANPWAGGLSAAQFSTCDLDLDGKQDLVIFDRADHKVSTYLNKGVSGTVKYEYAPVYEKFIPRSTGWMLFRDYNCDGKKDIFIGYPGGIRVYKNISTPGYLKFVKVVNSILSLQPPSGTFPLYVSSVDIPSISDIDGDGDLDILAFGVLGATMEYHRNMSMETYGTCDSLKFALKNLCWGHFAEIGIASNKLKLFDTCNYNVSNPEDGVSRHAGSTITAFDNNGDSVADLLIGDVSFNNVVMGQNDGSKGTNMNTSLLLQDTAFPAYDTAVDLMLFPGIFLEDIDNDGIKDMICSPNEPDLTENLESAWMYKNTGTNSVPIFNFRQRNFIQDEMINTGQDAIPALFDYNGDSLMDLIVSNYGYFDRDSLAYINTVYLYENIGTKAKPIFDLITEDYMGISALNLGNSLHPAFGDIDNDGDIDVIVGNSEGYSYLFTNSAGAGNIAVFSFTDTIKNNMGNIVDIGQFAVPQLFDYDKDGDLDLIYGKVNGTLTYYENTGTSSSYIFNKITDSLGKVEIREPWDTYGASSGYSTPYFFVDSGTTYLYCGGQQGEVYKFSGINPSNPFQTFVIDDTIFSKYQIGLRSVPVIYDFGTDGKLDMFVGNKRGGVRLFTQGVDTLRLSMNEIKNNKVGFSVFPNPTKNLLFVKLDKFSFNSKTITVRNILGELLLQKETKQLQTAIDVSSFSKGMYFVTVFNGQDKQTKRFIVQ